MILPIYKERIPYEFEVRLGDDIYVFEVHYNGDNDFISVDLYRNGEVIIYGEKVVYGRPLFEAMVDARLPDVSITPLDPSNEENRVGYDNLGETVFLYVGETP